MRRSSTRIRWLALVATLAFNLVGDRLRDALDPRGSRARIKVRRDERRRRKRLAREQAGGEGELTRTSMEVSV